MKMDKIRELTSEELQLKVRELNEEMFNLRFQKSTGQAGNPLRIRLIRKDIARIQTFLRQRELETKSLTG